MIAKLRAVTSRLRETRTAFGGRAAAESIVDRVGKLIIGLQVVEVVWLESAQLASLQRPDSRFTFRFLTADEVRAYSRNPELKLAPELSERIEAGRDLCFAALEGDRLAAYGWYALDCIEGAHNFGVPMSFPADVAYMYNGFTHPSYRGLRLHGLVMGLALQGLEVKGVSRLVSTVDWTNQASLRSCVRLGYSRLGRLVTIGGDLALIAKVPHQASRRGVRFGHLAERRRLRRVSPPQPQVRLFSSEFEPADHVFSSDVPREAEPVGSLS
ncbi:MAG: GNAT family N-acetyltransferase [Planctomycetaceae bacterium]|nr:GNAT family N-acetyltransferase [Planctomycetaceae bacterium]